MLAAKSNGLSSVPETHTTEGEKAKCERESVFRKLSTAEWRRTKDNVRAGSSYQSTACKTPGTPPRTDKESNSVTNQGSLEMHPSPSEIPNEDSPQHLYFIPM